MPLRLLQDHLTYGYIGKVFRDNEVPYFEKAMFERLNERYHGYEYSIQVKQLDSDDDRFDGEYLYETAKDAGKLMERILKKPNSQYPAIVTALRTIILESHKGKFEFRFERVTDRSK